MGGSHLHLLVFPFVYQFHSRIETIVCSSFANDKFRRISASFHHHFKICLLWLLHEKECIYFAVLKWDVCLSVQVPFELPILIQLLLELKANWIDQNVNELEFELSRMHMKGPMLLVAAATKVLFPNFSLFP